MNKLLIVIPFSANDAPIAERNLDHIYRMNGKCANGHVLLVANSDVHAEMRAKIRVTAELAFESVTETITPAIDPKLANSKFHQMNNLFRHAAKIVQSYFRWPWFWMEADCVPVDAYWISLLAADYDTQPKKYMGLIAQDDKGKFMARCSVYYNVASYELDKLCQGESPFPRATAEKVVDSATKSDLIQYLNIETVEDLKKISDRAVVVHGDKMGIFAENWEPILEKDIERALGALRGTPSEIITPSLNDTKGVNGDAPLIATFKTADGFRAAVIPEPTAESPRLSRRQKRELETPKNI